MNNLCWLLASIMLLTVCTSITEALQKVQNIDIFSLSKDKLAQLSIRKNHFLAYENKLLTPAKTVVLSHNLPLAHTFFVVAADQHSKRWVLQQREKLTAQNAIGLLIAAKNAASIEQITSLVPQLAVYAVAASWVVETFGLKHYPAIISPTRSKR